MARAFRDPIVDADTCSRPARIVIAARRLYMSKKKRLNLELGPKAYQRVEDLIALTEANSVAEVLRNALGVYDRLIRARAAGMEVVLRRRDGSLDRELILADPG